MKHMLVALFCLGLMGCVTTESTSGWSFQKDNYSNHGRHSYGVVDKSDGHPVRSGEKSMRFEVRPGDCTLSKWWNDCAKYRERSELIQFGTENGENWYHWSVYLSKESTNTLSGDPVLGQFHYKHLGASKGLWGGPVAVFFRLKLIRIPGTKEYAGAYIIDQMFGGPRDRILATVDDMIGKWTDVLVHANWSRKDDGFFRVYVNGNTKPVFAYSGRNKPKEVNFKFGIYRGDNEDTQIVYYDDVRKGKTCSEVTEYFPCDMIMNGARGS